MTACPSGIVLLLLQEQSTTYSPVSFVYLIALLDVRHADRMGLRTDDRRGAGVSVRVRVFRILASRDSAPPDDHDNDIRRVSCVGVGRSQRAARPDRQRDHCTFD